MRMKRLGFTLIEFLIVILIITVIVVLLIRAMDCGPFDRTLTRNHVKQILLALLNYQDDYGRFPPPTDAGGSGKG